MNACIGAHHAIYAAAKRREDPQSAFRQHDPF